MNSIRRTSTANSHNFFKTGHFANGVVVVSNKQAFLLSCLYSKFAFELAASHLLILNSLFNIKKWLENIARISNRSTIIVLYNVQYMYKYSPVYVLGTKEIKVMGFQLTCEIHVTAVNLATPLSPLLNNLLQQNRTFRYTCITVFTDMYNWATHNH